MVRLKMYESKATRGPKGQRSEYQGGLVYNVEDDVATEWMIGAPPAAWPEDEERPKEWPKPLSEEDMAEFDNQDEPGTDLVDTDY